MHHQSSGAADRLVQAGSTRGVEAKYPSSRDHVRGASGCWLVLSMCGDPTPGDMLTPAKAPALHQQLTSISLEMQGTTEVRKAFWIVAMWEGTIALADIDFYNDYFVSSTNDPSLSAGWWISERDGEIQFSNWVDKLSAFVQRIAELKWQGEDVRGLIGGVILDWQEETRDICLSALRNLPINRWISQVELRLPHPYRPRPIELHCFEYEHFAYTA